VHIEQQQSLLHLISEPSSLVLDVGIGVPRVLYFGAKLGAETDLASLLLATRRAVPRGTYDEEGPLTMVPAHADASGARPALEGHRVDGSAWSPKFSPESTDSISISPSTVGISAVDPIAELRLTVMIEEASSGVFRFSTTLTNTATTSYQLHRLHIALPIPAHYDEILEFPGRWTDEMRPQRERLGMGARSWDNRRGRPSHQNAPGLFVGTPNFGETHGEVLGLHFAWSGYHEMRAERHVDGRGAIQAGVAFSPGEMNLSGGASFTTPWLYATHSSTGLNGASQAFHSFVRSRTNHPRSTRPVTLNSWEALYFDHDSAKLFDLATAAAEVGIERFVLDDGWFMHRRTDNAGLGDWYIDPSVYPNGLTPLISHVRSLGMEFGLWFEPEMVNPNSDLFRAHPDWALTTDGYEPKLARDQLVLDLSNNDVYAYLLECIDTILRDHEISYVKWDFNRDILQGSHDQRASAYTQTLALYRLLAELNERHPNVEIETCSSGGGRADYAITKYTKRIWTSDCIDALERQRIQRSLSYFFPPEYMGAHIGPSPAHTTGRRHTVAFRAATALFGHLGVEWDVSNISADDREALKTIISLHKQFRSLLHSGNVVRADPTNDASIVHGVVTSDKQQALFAYVQCTTGPTSVPHPLRFVGLDPNTRYRIAEVQLPGGHGAGGHGAYGPMKVEPNWLRSSIILSGASAMSIGVSMPVCNPETAVLVHLEAVKS
jgi:alpha-galactosidase